jgi:ubiquinol-cytochrome c reductase cytochrome c subunit
VTRLVPVVLAALTLLVAAPAAGQDEPPDGEALYLEGCSSCHGAGGAGTDRGPSLARSGEAAAFYYLSTGRMPLSNSEEQPRRKPPVYDVDELGALVRHVGSLGDGPGLPDDLDPDSADLAHGGELFRENCQACHSASGAGGALSYGRAAPQLAPATPLEIAAAVRAGPGQMPVFGQDALSDADVAAVARYVEYLDDPADPGGLPIARTGPIPEGFVAWFLGMGALLGLVAWIGTRSPPREADR